MVDFGQIFKGEACFLMGFIMIIVIDYILPPIIEAGEGIYSGGGISEVIWFGALLIYVLAGVVMPLIFVYQGITTQSDGNPFSNIILGLLTFIINIALTIKGWFMITAVGALSTDAFTTAIYWVGFVTVWLAVTIATPAYIIIHETEKIR